MPRSQRLCFIFLIGVTLGCALAQGETIAISAGTVIAPFGGQFWDTPADSRLLQNPEYRFADSPDELRKAIRENM